MKAGKKGIINNIMLNECSLINAVLNNKPCTISIYLFNKVCSSVDGLHLQDLYRSSVVPRGTYHDGFVTLYDRK